jgi:hypothetical protein
LASPHETTRSAALFDPGAAVRYRLKNQAGEKARVAPIDAQ